MKHRVVLLLLLPLLPFIGPAHADLASDLYPKGPPPADLRILVLEYDQSGHEIRREAIGDPADRDWWPASTIKIFAAIGALEAIEALGFDHRATVSFARPGRSPYTRRFGWLVGQAVTQSSNLAYDRLVQFTGHDALHADLLGPKRGLGDAALQVPYSQNVISLLESPAITIRRGKRTHVIAARDGKGTTRCPMATCSSLNSLAEAMRRVMLHEQLPETERLRLSPASLKVLRSALAGDRARGREVINALKAAFKRHDPKLYHKPGYYPRWRSDVVFMKAGKRRWIVALANEGGRKALNDPARRLARWMVRSRPPATRTAQ